MRDVTSDEVISHECVSGDDLCEFFPFIISIENGNVQYHSNHTGSAAIYSREISRERSRMTLFYHMSVNQRLIANMVGCLFHSNLSEIWPRTMERKRINNLLLYRKSPNQCCKLSLKSPEGSG